MTTGNPPRRDADAVAALAADWHRRFAGRTLARLAGGTGWLRPTLIDAREDHRPPAHCYLLARHGAVLAWDDVEPLPRAWTEAMQHVSQRQLTAGHVLLGAVLEAVVAPPGERILALRFLCPDGTRCVLAHQLFGPRGNLVLTDADGRRLWSAHVSPHTAALGPFPAAPLSPPDPDLAPAWRADARTQLALLLREEVEQAARTALRRAAHTAATLQENLSRDLAGADRGDVVRGDAETLAIHLHALRRGLAEAVLADAAGQERRITLDPRLTPAENMERLFRQARKAERGRETIAARLRDAEAALLRLAALEQELEALSVGADPIAEIPAWRELHHDLIGPPRRSPAGRRAEPEDKPFRRYLVDGRWEVWVGRSNIENDELTHRASSPDDWWFHAQGVPGSHVVLRSAGAPDQVPRAVLEKAAAVAAHYSRSRSSGLAPVIYTLRKYVRKPRKAPPGTAAPTREKSLMVEPGIPAGVEPLA